MCDSNEYFVIQNPETNLVLTVVCGDKCSVETFSGKDHQLWYWFDECNLKCKAYPDKFLDLNGQDYNDQNWGQVSLYHTGHGGKNQQWRIEGCEIISNWCDLRLDIFEGCGSAGTNVGCYQKHDGLNQQWSIVSKYFMIQNIETNLMLTVVGDDERSHGELPCTVQPACTGTTSNDNQLWYWSNGNNLKCKAYPDKILDLNGQDHNDRNWGQVSLYHTEHGGENQQWTIDGCEIKSNWCNLRLDIFEGCVEAGTNVGCYQKNDAPNQQWRVVNWSIFR